jgi:hypothetical protein
VSQFSNGLAGAVWPEHDELGDGADFHATAQPEGGTSLRERLFEAIFAPDRPYRLIPTRANGQPAFGVYVRDPATGVLHANGMLAATLAGDRVRALTRFDNSVIARFGLPRRLPPVP